MNPEPTAAVIQPTYQSTLYLGREQSLKEGKALVSYEDLTEWLGQSTAASRLVGWTILEAAGQWNGSVVCTEPTFLLIILGDSETVATARELGLEYKARFGQEAVGFEYRPTQLAFL